MALFFDSLDASPFTLSEHLERARQATSVPIENFLADLQPADIAQTLGMTLSPGTQDERIQRIKSRLLAAGRAVSQPRDTFRHAESRCEPYKGQRARDRMRDSVVHELLMRPLADDERSFALGAFGAVPPRRWADGLPKEQFRATICIGSPGAGKSTVIRRAMTDGVFYISADFVKRKLPEFQTLGAAAVHEESVFVAEALFMSYLVSEGHSFCIEKLGRTPEDIEPIASALRSKGYRVHLELVHVPPEKCIIRVADRAAETGRDIDPAFVWGVVGAGPIMSYCTLKDQSACHEYRAYDNDVPFGRPPLRIPQ